MSCNFSFSAHLNFELPIKHPNGDIKYTLTQVLSSGEKAGAGNISLRIIGLGMVFKTTGLDELT